MKKKGFYDFNEDLGPVGKLRKHSPGDSIYNPKDEPEIKKLIRKRQKKDGPFFPKEDFRVIPKLREK